MFQNDYLMRMILQLVAVIQRALRYEKNRDDEQTAQEIEVLIGSAVGIDPGLLFSMAPESMVSLLQLGDFDDKLCAYVVRSIYFEAELLERQGLQQRADLRRAQADAIDRAYGAGVTSEDLGPEALAAFFCDPEEPDAKN